MPHYAVEGPSGSEEAGHSPLIRSNSTDPHSSNPATSRQQDPVAPPQSGNNQPNTHDVRPVDRREFQRLQASVDRMMTLMETMSMSQHNASSDAVPAHPQPPPAQQTQSDPHHRPLFFPPHQQTQSFSSHRPFPQSFHHAPHLFPPNPQQQSNNTPQFRSHPAAQLPPTAHVPPTAQARRPAASAPQQAYEHQLVAEPPKLEDIWFTGDSVHLLHFLRLVRNFLRINLHFQSDSRRIAWIAQHFGHPPSHHSAIPAPSINWYNSLIIENSRRQGVYDIYEDHHGIPFRHEKLVSVSAFLDALIADFGDKFIGENAKRALEACKQKNRPIGEYNSQFKSLVYLVADDEESRIEKYVSGLNPWIVRQAMSTEWTRCTSLDRKMQLAWKAADQADRLALLPPAPGFGGAPELPSSARLPPSQVPRQQAPSHRQAHGPEAMEADAARAVPATPATRALLDACRALCRARGRCFRCLAPSVPGAHTGAADCPDLFVSAARRQAFVDECRTNPGHASVAAISAPPVLPTPLSYTAASPTNFSIHATAHSRSR